MSTVPPVSRDAQTHHLALPKIWLSQGILTEVPDMDFSYYPQLIDLLYILPVKMDIDITAKYIHFAFGLGCALLIFLFIRRFIGSYWAALGGLMFLTVPVIIKLSVTVYVDLGLLFFFTASLFSALIWMEDTKKLRWLVLSAICSGLSMSVKYNAMLSVLLMSLLLAYFYLKTRKGKNKEQIKLVKYAALFSLVALLVYSPWLIRNYSLTGNPIYPLHQSLFSKHNDIQNDNKELQIPEVKQPKPLTFRRLVFNESFPYILALPIRVFLEGKDDDPQYFDGRLNPLLLLFPFLLFLNKKQRWQNQFFVSFVSLTLLYTMLATGMRIRYIITIIPPMIVLSIFGLYHLNKWLQTKSKLAKLNVLIVTTLLSVYFLYNLSYGINLYKKIDPLPYITGKVSRDEYINNELPYYALNKLANEVVSLNKKLLGIYTGNRRYYIDVPLSLESTLLFILANQVNDVNELIQELLNRDITHILVRIDLFQNELSRKDIKTQKLLVEFFSNNVELIKSADVFALYKINPL